MNTIYSFDQQKYLLLREPFQMQCRWGQRCGGIGKNLNAAVFTMMIENTIIKYTIISVWFGKFPVQCGILQAPAFDSTHPVSQDGK